MRVVLAGVMLVAVMAGCLGGSDKDEADILPDPTGDGLNTTLPNSAPLANLTSDASGNGTAPLNVTFDIRASDADGDNLTWTLTLGNVTIGNGTSMPAGNATPASGNATAGNGTSTGNSTAGNATGTLLRANVTHQFTEAGNYTVVLNVTDGTNSTLQNLTITVLPGDQMNGTGAASEDDYVIFNADGTCDAKGEVAVGPEYFHSRGTTSGSIWWYEESNDIDGLQVGGDAEEGAYKACLNPDFLIF